MFRQTRCLLKHRFELQPMQLAEESLPGNWSRSVTAWKPSERVREFAAESKVGYPQELRLIPAQNFKDFAIRVAYSRNHVFSAYHMRHLGAPEYPLTERILYWYAQQKSRALWCQVQAQSSDGGNAVVRKTSERYVRGALVRALKAAGYDSTGKSLDGHETEVYGTIRILVTQPKEILKVEFDELLRYMNNLIFHTAPRLKRFTNAAELP